MDYEKKYKEALERAKKLYEQGTITESLSYVFPELKESEDERIRKCIGDVVREYDWSHIFGVTKDDCLSWIEKQGEQILANSAKTCKDEQKPTDEEMKTLLRTEYEKGRADAIDEMQNPAWSEEDRTMAFTLMRDVDQMSYISKEGKNERIGWLNSLDEKFASTESIWGEEDEKMLNDIDITFFEEKSIPNVKYWKFMNWLKSLKDRMQPQPKWSEEDEGFLDSAL